ncbi:MAG: hydrogenase maturation nickel metallochaperone HypA [Bacteroidota bacterium]|nr:hydrogenase maturation nickel metallochaperone HypA [Bacteroidota bacterium]
MHEMSIAQNIIEIVKEHVPKEANEKVKRIRLKIGELSGVVPDSLLFCFDILKNGSALGNVSVEIEHVPITARCRSCDKTSQLEYGVFFCTSCHSSDIELLTGKELNIVDIELND